MFKRFSRWLDRVPISDAVDRRNARIIQVLLLFLAVTVPVSMVFAVATAWAELARGPLDRGMLLSIGLSQLAAVTAVVGLVLIRRGRLRLAVTLFIAALLALLVVNGLVNGLQRQLQDQVGQMLVLMLSGLVLGRRALWTSFAVLLVMVGLGVLHDAVVEFAQTPMQALYNVPPLVFSYLLVTILLDYTSAALRESLRESNARGERLQQEMLERERAQEQLIHAQKKEITERMASGMAHDFNNILAVIVGFASTREDDDAESSAELAARLRGSLQAVEESARRGMAISRRLLRFSRRELEDVERFDAGQAVEELQPMLRQLLEARVSLHYAPAGQPLPIAFERSQFELLLLNLASNARDAIAGDGNFAIALHREGAHVVIEVSDDGHGMPPAVAGRVFEPFFSTKPADGGTGLGLAVVHEMVRKAGGGIAVDSAVGAGCRFRIVLPHADDGGAAAPVAQDAAPKM